MLPGTGSTSSMHDGPCLHFYEAEAHSCTGDADSTAIRLYGRFFCLFSYYGSYGADSHLLPTLQPPVIMLVVRW